MGIAAFLRTTATTSTTSRKGRRSRRCATCCGTAACPNRAELGDLQSQLAAARPVPEPILRLMKQLPASDGMDMLRTLTSALGQYDPEVNDSSPQAQYRKAVRLTAQMAQHRRHLRADAGGRRTHPAGSGARPRRQLPLHAHGQPAERARDPRVRHRARAARRPRAERLDVRGARRRPRRSPTSTRRSSARSARSRGRCTAAPTRT